VLEQKNRRIKRSGILSQRLWKSLENSSFPFEASLLTASYKSENGELAAENRIFWPRLSATSPPTAASYPTYFDSPWNLFPRPFIMDCMVSRLLVVLLFLSSLSAADIVNDVRSSLGQKDFTAADTELQAYRTQHGVTPEYLEGLSWMGRAALAANQLDRAASYAQQTESLSRQQLLKRSLDAEPHLPTALGAALEVQAQVLAAQGHQPQAVALLQRNIAIYRNTSIQARLQKNLNLLALAGQPAPTLDIAHYLGERPVALSQLKGSPVLLFFWAHWCPDCKYEGPIIARLSGEFASKGLTVVAPTQLYGYAAQGQDAKPEDELAYTGRVWQHFYPGLQSVPVPVSKQNFDRYGASTTPTLVLVDRGGKIALYHPGAMPYDDLRSAIERTLSN
jgi:thiol-disulfide isomerase/thioredoxin